MGLALWEFTRHNFLTKYIFCLLLEVKRSYNIISKFVLLWLLNHLCKFYSGTPAAANSVPIIIKCRSVLSVGCLTKFVNLSNDIYCGVAFIYPDYCHRDMHVRDKGTHPPV